MSGKSVLVRERETGKILYAVAFEDGLRCRIDYLHAHSQAHARHLFLLGWPRSRRPPYIVSVAPAIGFHVTDEHGDKLTA